MDAGLTNLNTEVHELRHKINDNQKEIKAANDFMPIFKEAKALPLRLPNFEKTS